MDKSEAYWFLFSDTFFSNIAINIHSEFAIHAMKMLGTYDIYIVLFYSIIASIASTIVNYIFGIIFHNIYKCSSDQKIQKRYDQLSRFFQKYGYIILIFVALQPIGKFTQILAGFTKFGILRTILVSLIGKILYYAYILFL
jgi:membrane protein YqaA with SNARE-associated domain